MLKTLMQSFLKDITMFECLIRNQEVYRVKKLTVDDAIKNIRYMDARRKESKAKSKRTIDEVIEGSVEPVDEDDIPDMTISRTRLEMKGHTSYLTFATFLPIEAGSAPAATE
jgi:tRNA (adenine57-N1/adenine58-N1)-methyltransferase